MSLLAQWITFIIVWSTWGLIVYYGYQAYKKTSIISVTGGFIAHVNKGDIIVIENQYFKITDVANYSIGIKKLDFIWFEKLKFKLVVIFNRLFKK